jgi:hypothetical protein
MMGAPTPVDVEIRPDPLAEFLLNNPTARVRDDTGGRWIDQPWSDESLTIRVPAEARDLVDRLNAIYLPLRLNAIYHRKDRTLEFIYTVLEPNDPIRDRAFPYSFKSRSYNCKFSVASETLMAIAKAAQATEVPPLANRRNLSEISFSRLRSGRLPTSFYISGVDWDEDGILELVQHLNFYMRYFDSQTPVVQILSDAQVQQPNRQDRFPFGEFPRAINAKTINPIQLRFWEATFGADPFRQFFHNYQILEYAAFSALSDDVLTQLKQILAAPDTLLRSSEAARQILDLMPEMNGDDGQRLRLVFKKFVRPEAVWRAVGANLDFFSSSLDFDGGTSLEPIVERNWTLEVFSTKWLPSFPDKLRQIRNAIAQTNGESHSSHSSKLYEASALGRASPKCRNGSDG